MDRLQEIRENVKRDVAASEGAYSDRAWLLGEYDRLLALLDQAQKAALHAQDHCLKAQERAFAQAAYAVALEDALVRAHDTMLMVNGSDLGRSDREALEGAREYARAALAKKNPSPAANAPEAGTAEGQGTQQGSVAVLTSGVGAGGAGTHS